MLTSSGIIVYDPDRGNMKKKVDWWCVIETNNEITRYYRWWVERHYHIRLNLPAWGAHVSVIRGEQPREHLKHLWKKYHGKRVRFQYDHFPRWSGDSEGVDRLDAKFWFVDVQCAFAKQIRDEFELPSHWKFHLTFGRNYVE